MLHSAHGIQHAVFCPGHIGTGEGWDWENIDSHHNAFFISQAKWGRYMGELPQRMASAPAWMKS